MAPPRVTTKPPATAGGPAPGASAAGVDSGVAQRAAGQPQRLGQGLATGSQIKGALAFVITTDSALDTELITLRQNSNELYRNFGYATAAIENRTNNVIGTATPPTIQQTSTTIEWVIP